MRRWRRNLWAVVCLMLVLVPMWTVEAAAAGDLSAFLPLKQADGIVTEVTDIYGQTHMCSGVLDVEQLADDPDGLMIESYRVWHEDNLLLESSLRTENAAFLFGTEQTPATLNGYYTAEFMIDDIHQVFLTGLTEKTLVQVQEELVDAVLDGREFLMTNVDFIDTEKEITIELEDGAMEGDSQMCWAAATSNMLHYTGWGKKAGFADEDEIFETFIDYFDDHGGQYIYGLDWFFNGINYKQNNEGWAHVEKNYGTFLGYLPEYSANANYQYIRIDQQTGNICTAMEKLRSGYAMGVSFGFYLAWMRQGGHAVTMWGYIRDISKNEWNKEAYTALFLTDSDSDKVEYQPRRSAPENLSLMPISPYRNNKQDSWMLDGYTAFFYNAVLESFTALAPCENAAAVETEGTRNRFTTPDLLLTDLSVCCADRADSTLEQRVFSESDNLTLKFLIQNAGALAGRKEVQIGVTITKDGSVIRDKVTSQVIYLNENGSVNGTIAIGTLPQGSYEVALEVDFAEPIQQAYENNNKVTTSLQVSNQTCSAENLVLSASVGDLDGETGGIAAISVSGLESVSSYVGNASYVLFASYDASGSWTPLTHTTEVPETAQVLPIGSQVRFLLMILPEDETKPPVLVSSDSYKLRYYKLSVIVDKEDIYSDETFLVDENATSLPDGKKISSYVSYTSINWTELTYTLRYYAKHKETGQMIELVRQPAATIGKQGGNTRNTPFCLEHWETPLPQGTYDIYVSIESNLGSRETFACNVYSLSDSVGVSCSLYANEPSRLNFEVSAYGKEASGKYWLEYGLADQEETETGWASNLTLALFNDYYEKSRSSFNAFPGAEYRARGVAEIDGEQYVSDWQYVTAADILSKELTLNQMGDIYVDQELSDHLFFHYPVPETGIYILKAPAYGSVGSVQYALKSGREWLFADAIRGDVGGERAIQAEAGDRIYVRLNTMNGGAFSIGIFTPSVEDVSDLKLIRLQMEEQKATMAVTATVPYGVPISMGVEYGLDQEKLVVEKLRNQSVTGSEMVFNMAYLNVPVGRTMYFRGYLINHNTGTTLYTPWQTLQTTDEGYIPLKFRETNHLRVLGEEQFYCFTAEETGWYQLQADISGPFYVSTLELDNQYGWQWESIGTFTPSSPETVSMWMHLQAGETACLKIYAPKTSETATFRILGNEVTAQKADGQWTVSYRPDQPGIQIVAIYRSDGKLIKTQYAEITDVMTPQVWTVDRSDAAEVRVFQLDAHHRPLKDMMQTDLPS